MIMGHSFLILALLCSLLSVRENAFVLPWLTIESVRIKQNQCIVQTISRFEANPPEKLLITCSSGNAPAKTVEITAGSNTLFRDLTPDSSYTFCPVFFEKGEKVYGRSFSWDITTLPAQNASGPLVLEEVSLSRQCRFTIAVPRSDETPKLTLQEISDRLRLRCGPGLTEEIGPLSVRPLLSARDRDLFMVSLYLPPHEEFEFSIMGDGDRDALRYRFQTPPFHNLSWCELPLETEKAAPLYQGRRPQDIVHPSVLFSEYGIFGHHLWIAATPWPQCINSRQSKIVAEFYENPCIFHGDLENGQLPTRYSGIGANPLMTRTDAGNGFNSDPDLLWVDNRLYCITRQRHYDYTRITNRFVVQHSDDGKRWSSPVPVLETGNGESHYQSLSPMLLYRDKTFFCYLIERTPDNKAVQAIDIYRSDDLTRPNSLKLFKHGQWSNPSISPWHGDIFEYRGDLFMVFNVMNGGMTYLARSVNHVDWQVYPVPIVNIPSSYHPCGVVRESNRHLIIFTSYLGLRGFRRDYPTGHRVAFHDLGDFERVLQELACYSGRDF